MPASNLEGRPSCRYWLDTGIADGVGWLGTGQRHIYARVSTPISVTYAGVLTVCSHVVRLSAPPKLRRCRSTAGSADGDIVTACIFMACAVMAYTVVAYILMAHTVMAAAGSADGM